MPGSPPEDWLKVVRRVADGDRVAFAMLGRLTTGFLARWRAFDFRCEWDDVVQEVVSATVDAVREDKLRNPSAVLGYMRSTAHFKFVDRLRLRQREAPGVDPEDEIAEVPWAARDLAPEERQAVRDAVARLPEKHRLVISAVYAQGMTYDEAAAATGIPLGSLKRYLREALKKLKEDLE